jgi:hypothetical protein
MQINIKNQQRSIKKYIQANIIIETNKKEN